MGTIQKVTPHLWFDTQAEEAAQFYTSIFRNASMGKVTRYRKEGQGTHRKAEGTVMTVAFTIEGQKFLALNGGPTFRFSPAISFVIHCNDQEEVDYYWDHLAEGGEEKAQQCGWLADKFGESWQIVPTLLHELLEHPDEKVAGAVMEEMLQMKKIDINVLERIREQKEQETD